MLRKKFNYNIYNLVTVSMFSITNRLLHLNCLEQNFSDHFHDKILVNNISPLLSIFSYILYSVYCQESELHMSNKNQL